MSPVVTSAEVKCAFDLWEKTCTLSKDRPSTCPECEDEVVINHLNRHNDVVFVCSNKDVSL